MSIIDQHLGVVTKDPLFQFDGHDPYDQLDGLAIGPC